MRSSKPELVTKHSGFPCTTVHRMDDAFTGSLHALLQLGENTCDNSELAAMIDSQPLNLPSLTVPTTMQSAENFTEVTCMERCRGGEASQPDRDSKGDDLQIVPSQQAQAKDACELPNQAKDSSTHKLSTECYMVSPLYAYPYTCGAGIALKGSFPTHLFIGQKPYMAVLAAAEARKRRKEITLSKFPRHRRRMK
jgi:hypothetical protein